jgi:cyanobactin biosynthesis protein (PatB/AcyB/McaB family)
MRLPIQSYPVKRPHVIESYSVVELQHGSDEAVFNLFVNCLTHGGNFNDPAQWQLPTFQNMKSM